MRSILNATYDDRLTVKRCVYKAGKTKTEVVYDNIPCGLSRNATTYSPSPINLDTRTPRAVYRLRFYTSPDVIVKLGDFVEITKMGRVYKGIAADSFNYDSHMVCVFECEEVE